MEGVSVGHEKGVLVSRLAREIVQLHARETRSKSQDAVREDFIQIAEDVTGRSVRALLSQVDIEQGIAVELFLFEAEPEDREELQSQPR